MPRMRERGLCSGPYHSLTLFCENAGLQRRRAHPPRPLLSQLRVALTTCYRRN